MKLQVLFQMLQSPHVSTSLLVTLIAVEILKCTQLCFIRLLIELAD